MVCAVAGGWQAGSLGGQAPGAQLGWQQPGIGGLQAHTPGVNAPMTSMPRGPLHNGVGILGSAPSGFRGAPGNCSIRLSTLMGFNKLADFSPS